MNAVTYLERFLEPDANVFTPTFATAIVDLQADDELQGDIDTLRRKAERGELTQTEQAEYAAFVGCSGCNLHHSMESSAIPR